MSCGRLEEHHSSTSALHPIALIVGRLSGISSDHCHQSVRTAISDARRDILRCGYFRLQLHISEAGGAGGRHWPKLSPVSSRKCRVNVWRLTATASAESSKWSVEPGAASSVSHNRRRLGLTGRARARSAVCAKPRLQNRLMLDGAKLGNTRKAHQFGLDEWLVGQQCVELLARLGARDQHSAGWRNRGPRK